MTPISNSRRSPLRDLAQPPLLAGKPVWLIFFLFQHRMAGCTGRAIATSVLFTIGKFLIGLYLGSGTIASGYCAAGALNPPGVMGLLLGGRPFLLGADFTRVYAHHHGSRAE
jgi:hypothetical protein